MAPVIDTAMTSVPSEDRPLRIALVAGELSGDLLGGAIVRALRRRLPPDARIYGVAGPHMIEAGSFLAGAFLLLAVFGLSGLLIGGVKDLVRARRTGATTS